MQVYGNSSGLYYFLNNHLGTPIRLVDNTGTVVWQAAHLPFGKAEVTVEKVTNNFRFPGQYFDKETGLHYNMHRYYEPSTGRYLTADPIGLNGGINLYAYVAGNPVNGVDPWGLADCIDCWKDYNFCVAIGDGHLQHLLEGIDIQIEWLKKQIQESREIEERYCATIGVIAAKRACYLAAWAHFKIAKGGVGSYEVSLTLVAYDYFASFMLGCEGQRLLCEQKK